MRCSSVVRRCIRAGLVALALALPGGAAAHADTLRILPEAGRTDYLQAFAEARSRIRIEICVLEDPQILAGLRQAIARGVNVQVIVDRSKYDALLPERENLAKFLTGPGGHLHLSNPIFPRSFPKVILIDDDKALVGSACLDTTTFQKYRDYFLISTNPLLISDLTRLFDNDWRYSTAVGGASPPFNPTPPLIMPGLAVGPVNAASRLTALIQSARSRLDVTSELLGNAAIQSELVAAARRGVKVRLISPLCVNAATPEEQALQNASLKALQNWGVQVHVTGPAQSFQAPYMHARTMLADGARLYIGSISLSPDSTTFNREVGLFLTEPSVVWRYTSRFEQDFATLSRTYSSNCKPAG